jgi:chromosomal replication initiation ATPase DnaA
MTTETQTESGSESTLGAGASHPWDGFVTGPETAMAQAAVLALVRGEMPTGVPLVVHGPSGSGKTRLLQALVGEWLLRRPGSAVAHLEAEAFAAACAEAQEQRDGWPELRQRFRSLDLFVLDDLHALERAPLALAELTHTLDALTDLGGAVAVSARTGPGQWRGWPDRPAGPDRAAAVPPRAVAVAVAFARAERAALGWRRRRIGRGGRRLPHT